MLRIRYCTTKFDRDFQQALIARNFPNDKGMNCNQITLEQRNQPRVSLTQMVDPNRRVDEYQGLIRWRRRGVTARFDWLAPSLARRRALWRSISAFKPSRNNIERSVDPVNLIALASSSSSIFTVVLIDYLQKADSIIATFDAQLDVERKAYREHKPTVSRRAKRY